MEAVLTAPSNLSSIMYYKRKLSEYSLNIFSLGDKETTCYVWNETEGQRGFNKIGTCLYKHTLSLLYPIQQSMSSYIQTHAVVRTEIST